MIAFYYGVTGFACAIYYRRELTTSAKNFFYIGVLPVLGGLILTAVFVKSFFDITQPDSGYAGPLFGVGAPFFIAAFALVLGGVLLVLCLARYPEFFRRRPEVASPDMVARSPAGQEGAA